MGAVFMLAPAQFVLVNAARQGRMGEDIFKKLNLSIAVAIVGLDASTIYGAQVGSVYRYAMPLVVQISKCES